MNDFLLATIDVSNTLLSILELAIVFQVILSWIRPDPNHRLVIALYKITHPILQPIQRIIPSFGGIDFSSIIAIGCIILIKNYLLAPLLLHLIT